MQVPRVAPADYTLTLRAFRGTPVLELLAGASLTRFEPATASAGTSVKIEGIVAGGKPASATDHVDVCWAGCARGFSESQPIEWLDGGRFRTQVDVPRPPWLTADGPQPLRPGRYSVEVRCIDGWSQNCRSVTGSIELGEPFSVRCVPDAPCAELSVTPAEARPGDVVRVEGWAPLVSIPSLSPITYSLNLRPGGPDGIPAIVREPTFSAIELAPTAVTVRAPASWRELGQAKPVVTQLGAGGYEMAPDPLNAALAGYCAADAAHITRDGGTTWVVVPTTGLESALSRTPWSLLWPDWGEAGHAVNCRSAVPDPAHLETVFVSAAAWPRESGPPQDTLLGFVTRDRGASWHLVGPPRSAPELWFGGFRLLDGGVAALFGGPVLPDRLIEPVLVRETTDGGATWSPGREHCPAAGPCVTWGSDVVVRCAGGAEIFQAVRTSEDGRTFGTPRYMPGLRPCALHSLVGMDDGSVLLVAGDEIAWEHAVMRSFDRGETWEALELPLRPDAVPDPYDSPRAFPGLTMLSDGSLLSMPYLLRPGTDASARSRPGMPPSG
jgi:hypothetical protein